MLFLSVAALTCLSSCGTEELEDQADALAVAPSPTPTPTPTPTGTPTPSPSPTGAPPPVAANVELPVVASGLNVGDLLVNSSGIPPSGAPDVVGAFRFVCGPSHFSYDDPIVHPGQPGAAHLHLFFGNTEADANSTYESLRKSGDSTCGNALNRSAYWMPALLDGQGSALMPHHISIYYKRRPASDPWFEENDNAPVRIPRGLRYVFGSPDPEAGINFRCQEVWSLVGTPGTMTHALNQCSAGQKLVATVRSPRCWDGKNLDSADHRSHMAREVAGRCPSSHPYVVARFTMTVSWEIETGDTPSLWRFSSDMGGAEPGSTFHADWFGAWEDSILDVWHDNCIDKLLSCNSGNLGDGTKLKENSLSGFGKAEQRKVPLHTIG